MALLGILEAAIGLAFVYLLVSMLCSGIVEWLAQRSGHRGRCLRAGLLNIITDRWTYLRLLGHPAIAALYKDVKGRIRHPSYIAPDTFVTALLDVLVEKAKAINGGHVDSNAHAARICAEHGLPVGRTVHALIERHPQTNEGRKAIAEWYEGAMQRVSGWYKRQARFQLFLAGLIVAAALNIDSIAIARQLLQADTLRAVLVDRAALAAEAGPQASPSAAQARAQIEELGRIGLDIGYACLDPAKIADPGAGLWSQLGRCWRDAPGFGGAWVVKLLGWLITAFAVSQGGPFWFDLLNRLVSIRGAGARPAAAKPQVPAREAAA